MELGALSQLQTLSLGHNKLSGESHRNRALLVRPFARGGEGRGGGALSMVMLAEGRGFVEAVLPSEGDVLEGNAQRCG